jgi:ankyrin repeat protein
MELPEVFANSTAAHDGDLLSAKHATFSDDSGAEGQDPNLTPVSEYQKTSDDEHAIHLNIGEQNASEDDTPKSDETLEVLTTAPELAMGWLPPMNFTPPKRDFEADDIDWIPRREDSMFGGDLFTPGWVRGHGKDKEGFCGRCEPGLWHKMQDMSYENDLTYRHGIDSSGIPLPRPSSIQPVEGHAKMWKGYCEACQGWRTLRTTKMGWNWFRHCVKVGFRKRLKCRKSLILEQEHNTPTIKAGAQPPRKPITQPTAQSITELVAAIKMGDLPIVASLVKQPGLILELDSCMRTPLHYAAELGTLQVVQLLLVEYTILKGPGEIRAFINAASSAGETALMLAASQGNKEVAELLVSKGAGVDASSTSGQTALDHAAEAGHQRIIEHLIRNNADLRKSHVYCQIRLRDQRIAQQEAESLKKQRQSIIAGEVVERSQNWTPLMVAAINGDVETIKSLLKKGVDIEVSSRNGETALMLGASRGFNEVVRILLSSGANIDATNAKGWTTLMLAVRDKDEKTVDLLLSKGADVNHLSPDRWTALAEATFQSQTSIIALLLRCGADTESKSSHDWTPLMHAAYKGDEEAVALLLKAGAKMDICSLHDETAILLAAAGSHTQIFKTLLDAGCAPEPAWAISKASLKDKMPSDDMKGGAYDRASLGWTPLMLACQNGLEDVVRMLLKVGVNLEPQSPYRKSALMIAKENGRLEIAKLLEDHTAVSSIDLV